MAATPKPVRKKQKEKMLKDKKKPFGFGKAHSKVDANIRKKGGSAMIKKSPHSAKIK